MKSTQKVKIEVREHVGSKLDGCLSELLDQLYGALADQFYYETIKLIRIDLSLYIRKHYR